VGVADNPLDDPRLTMAGLFIETCGGLTAQLGAVHTAHGLAGTDFDVLIRLARSPDYRLRMSDLAAQTDLSTSGITRIVDRLEHRGLIRRDSEPGDRRGCAAVLTHQGHQALAADLPPLLDAIQRCLIDPLTPTQLQGVTDGLRILRDALRPAAATRTP
jgi:DNA-binding MarR family transcriptional regulator